MIIFYASFGVYLVSPRVTSLLLLSFQVWRKIPSIIHYLLWKTTGGLWRFMSENLWLITLSSRLWCRVSKSPRRYAQLMHSPSYRFVNSYPAAIYSIWHETTRESWGQSTWGHGGNAQEYTTHTAWLQQRVPSWMANWRLTQRRMAKPFYLEKARTCSRIRRFLLNPRFVDCGMLYKHLLCIT